MKPSSGFQWVLTVLAVAILSGCTINRDIMFKTSRDHTFDQFQDTSSKQLRIQANDVLQFRLFANDGFKMIDLISEGGGRDAQFLNRNIFTYLVEYDGLVKLPILGRFPVAGLTVREAELALEDRYVEYYNRPFVQLLVVNRRVVVFPGGGGDARVVPLDNNNTTLLEALAAAGGMAKRGDARQVKLFRVEPSGDRKVYSFDLSDISGLKYGDIVLQGDDVIYVQPNPDLASEALRDIVPIMTLVTTIILAIGVVQGLAN